MSNQIKLNFKKIITTIGTIGEDSYDVSGETKIRVVIENAAGGNSISVVAKINLQTSFVQIGVLSGTGNFTVDVGTYDTIRFVCNTYSPAGDVTIVASSFDDTSGAQIDDNSIDTLTTWSSDKINNTLTALGDNYVRNTRFATISSGTSGTIAIPSEQQIILDDFGGTTDAVVTTISGGRPTSSPAQTVGGTIIAATFDASGNYTLIGTPSAYPVAIIYRVRQKFSTYVDTDFNIIGYATYDVVTSVNNKTGNVVLTATDVGALDAVNALTVELEWDQLYPSFYTEIVYDINDRVDYVDMWESPAKVTHLFNKVFTYGVGSQISKVVITHVPDGQILQKDFTYDINGFVTNVLRTYTP